MGCSDSKEAQTKDQSKPDNKPQKKEEPKKEDKPAEKGTEKKDEPQAAAAADAKGTDDGKWKNKNDAVQYLVKELGITEENATKIVDQVNDDDEDKLSDEEAEKLRKIIDMANNELKPLFESADANKSGKVTTSEACKVLAPKFPLMDEKGMKKMLKSFEDGDKFVQYGTFILFYCFIQNAREQLRSVFEAADENGTGKVTLTEAAHKLCEKFPNMDEYSVKKMLYRCSDGDGIVTYEEFIMFYAKLQMCRKTVIKKFEALDKDGDGRVKESVVIDLLVEETGMERDDCKAVVNSKDEGNDAYVSYEEFVESWSKMNGMKKK